MSVVVSVGGGICAAHRLQLLGRGMDVIRRGCSGYVIRGGRLDELC